MATKDVLFQIRMPRELRTRIDVQAKKVGVTTSKYVREKLQAVTLPSAPVVQMLTGRVKGVPTVRIEFPMPDTWRQAMVELRKEYRANRKGRQATASRKSERGESG